MRQEGTTSSDRPRQAPARRRAGRRIVIGALLLLLVIVAGLTAARVAILRAALDAGAAAAGLQDVRYRIASIGLGATRIADIAVGHEISVAELTLHYQPLRLLRLTIDEVAIAGARLDLTKGLGPFARLTESAKGEGATPQAAAPRLPRLQVSDGVAQLPGGGSVTLDDLRLMPEDQGYDLTVAKLAVSHAGQKMSASDLHGRIDWSAEKATPAGAEFTIASLRHDSAAPFVAPLSLQGTVRQDGTLWRLTAGVKGPETARVDLTASYDGARGTAEGRLTLPDTRFLPGGLQPADILPPLAGMTEARGAVSGHLGFRQQAGRFAVEGDWRIDRLSFKIADVPVEALTARVGLTGTEDPAQAVIRIDQARLDLAGGSVTVDKTQVRPLADSSRVVLGLNGIDLKESLAALAIDGVSGEGRIDGRIPILLSGAAVAVEAGKLETRGAGVLRIQSEEAAAALAQGGDDANLLLRALADFHFERLSLSVDKPLSGESRLALATLGHNPAVLDGHPFQINVTLTTNLDKLLGVFVEGSRLSQEVIRAIVGARRKAPQNDSR